MTCEAFCASLIVPVFGVTAVFRGYRSLWHCYQFLRIYMPSDRLNSEK